MAGGQERVLRRRVRTVESTKKITRAMELIAAAEMSRAQGRIAGSKPYLNGMERVLADVTADGSAPARLMGVPESPEHVGLVAIVSDRGLAGGYNAFVLRQAEREMKTGESAGRDYQISAAGKKAVPYLRFRGREVDHYVPMPDRPTYEDARKLSAGVVGPFLAGDLDLVQLVSTRFVSAGIQTVETRQLLPLVPPEAAERRERKAPLVAPPGDDDDQSPPSAARRGSPEETDGARGGFFEYEPAAEDLLALLVPRYAEAALYGALLEASASEHIARQRAMSAATENADELITNLRRVMNRARQDSITTEIMEIVGGAEAFRHGAKAETAEPFEYHEEQIA